MRELPLEMPRQCGDDVAMKSPVEADGSQIVPQRIREQSNGTLGWAIAGIAPIETGGATPEQIGARRQQAVGFIRLGDDHACRSIGGPDSPVDPHRPLNGIRTVVRGLRILIAI